jgi:hypothetical protein
MINTVGKISGYKINIQKSVAFLFIRNKETKKEKNQKNNAIHNNLRTIQ